ncbi:MAG: hypothetical protein V1818_03570 [Candidatus Aenigmatarchaeota archaeon]
MDSDEKIKFLKMAISCLRRAGDDRPIFSPDVPSENTIIKIKESIKTGEVDESFLERFFPMAYEGVKEYGFFEYFFLVHNRTICMLEKYTKNKLVEWCTAYPSRIVKRKDSKWVVERIDSKEIITDSECYPGIITESVLKIGDLVILHRDKIHMVLSQKEFETASEYYNRFKREQN